MKVCNHIPAVLWPLPIISFLMKHYFQEFPHTLSSSGGKNNVSAMTLQDLEMSTMEKQQRELKILLTELKDRDRELNMMVATHQHHLSSWDRDRHRAMDMERRSERFECEASLECTVNKYISTFANFALEDKFASFLEL